MEVVKHMKKGKSMKRVQNKSKWRIMLCITMLVSFITISYGMEKPEHKVLQEILVKMPGAINFLASDPFAGTTENNPLRWIIYNATSPQLDVINRAYEAVIAGKEFGIAPQSEDAKVMLSFPGHVRKYLVERLNIKGMDLVNSLLPMPALFIAILNDDENEIQHLLEAGADMNQLANPDGKGMQMPLDWAAVNGKHNAMRILIRRGAKISRYSFVMTSPK